MDQLSTVLMLIFFVPTIVVLIAAFIAGVSENV